MGILAPFRKAGGYLVAPANWPQVRRQWSGIRAMAGSIRQAPQAGRFVVDAEHRIDFEATAEAYRGAALEAAIAGAEPRASYLAMASVTADELRHVLMLQGRRAARLARAYGVSAVLLTGLWAWKVVSQPVEYASLFYTAVLLMSVLSLALLALVEAWRNWNLRTGRMAPIGEFLRTEDSWLPS